MARLNVAVEAACQKLSLPLNEQPDVITELLIALSIYVTDNNREPVSGLDQGSFSTSLLVPFSTGAEPLEILAFKEANPTRLPGVYFIRPRYTPTLFGNTFGVTVKKPRKPTPQKGGGGGSFVPKEFDSGFGMTTAVRGE